MKSPKCPKCESPNTCHIFWGLPADVNAWRKALDAGEIALGGDVLSDDDHKWHCNKCENEWGRRGDIIKSKISLKVEDAYPRDIGRGIVRIDYDSMDAIGALTRDIVEITGKRKTLAVCIPVYPSDDGKGIVRADKIVQNNVQSQIGSGVNIRKVRRNISKHVTVMPLQAIPPGMEQYLRDALDGVPVITGDEIAVRYFGKFVYFQVIKATPAGVISDTKTKLRIRSDDSQEKLSK